MSPTDLAAVRVSVEVALTATALGAPLAVALGYVLARRRFRGRTLVSSLLLAPLVVPPVVTGLALLALLGRHGPFASFDLAFTRTAAVAAALVVGLPLYATAARSAFEAIDPRLEEVSLALGVPPRATFFRVTLPLALPGLAAGAVLAAGRALGEFGATIVVAGDVAGHTRSIAVAVYDLLGGPAGEGPAMRLAWVSAALGGVVLFGYEALRALQRRRLDDGAER